MFYITTDSKGNKSRRMESAHKLALELQLTTEVCERANVRDVIRVNGVESDCVIVVDIVQEDVKTDKLFRINKKTSTPVSQYRFMTPAAFVQVMRVRKSATSIVHPVPKPHVLVGMCMFKLRLCFSGLSREERENLIDLVGMMGGAYEGNLTSSVTHLIAENVESNKCQIARQRTIPIVRSQWIGECFKRSFSEDFLATFYAPEFALPVFSKHIVISIELSDVEEKGKMKELVGLHGATYCSGLKVASTTHLLVRNCLGRKYKEAKLAGIKTVEPRWFFDSVAAQKALPERPYLIKVEDKLMRGSADGLASALPNSTTSPRCSLPGPPKFASKKENRATGSPYNLEAVMKYIHDQKKPQPLKGCHVHLAGISSYVKEKMQMAITHSCGVNVQRYHPCVNYVVIGPDTESTSMDQMRKAQIKHNCYIGNYITPRWLIDCLTTGRYMNPHNYVHPLFSPSRSKYAEEREERKNRTERKRLDKLRGGEKRHTSLPIVCRRKNKGVQGANSGQNNQGVNNGEESEFEVLTRGSDLMQEEDGVGGGGGAEVGPRAQSSHPPPCPRLPALPSALQNIEALACDDAIDEHLVADQRLHDDERGQEEEVPRQVSNVFGSQRSSQQTTSLTDVSNLDSQRLPHLTNHVRSSQDGQIIWNPSSLDPKANRRRQLCLDANTDILESSQESQREDDNGNPLVCENLRRSQGSPSLEDLSSNFPASLGFNASPNSSRRHQGHSLERRREFMLADMSHEEEKNYVSIIQRLGGRGSVGSAEASTSSTHLIIGEPSESEKYLAALAMGLWILKPSYLRDCDEKGRFLPEDKYEWLREDPNSVLMYALAAAARVRRVEVYILDEKPFHEWGVIVVGDLLRINGQGGGADNEEERKKCQSLVRIVKCGGASSSEACDLSQVNSILSKKRPNVIARTFLLIVLPKSDMNTRVVNNLSKEDLKERCYHHSCLTGMVINGKVGTFH